MIYLAEYIHDHGQKTGVNNCKYTYIYIYYVKMYIMCVHVEWIGSTGPILWTMERFFPSGELPNTLRVSSSAIRSSFLWMKSADFGREIEAGQTRL